MSWKSNFTLLHITCGFLKIRAVLFFMTLIVYFHKVRAASASVAPLYQIEKKVKLSSKAGLLDGWNRRVKQTHESMRHENVRWENEGHNGLLKKTSIPLPCEASVSGRGVLTPRARVRKCPPFYFFVLSFGKKVKLVPIMFHPLKEVSLSQRTILKMLK